MVALKPCNRLCDTNIPGIPHMLQARRWMFLFTAGLRPDPGKACLLTSLVQVTILTAPQKIESAGQNIPSQIR